MKLINYILIIILGFAVALIGAPPGQAAPRNIQLFPDSIGVGDSLSKLPFTGDDGAPIPVSVIAETDTGSIQSVRVEVQYYNRLQSHTTAQTLELWLDNAGANRWEGQIPSEVLIPGHAVNAYAYIRDTAGNQTRREWTFHQGDTRFIGASGPGSRNSSDEVPGKKPVLITSQWTTPMIGTLDKVTLEYAVYSDGTSCFPSGASWDRASVPDPSWCLDFELGQTEMSLVAGKWVGTIPAAAVRAHSRVFYSFSAQNLIARGPTGADYGVTSFAPRLYGMPVNYHSSKFSFKVGAAIPEPTICEAPKVFNACNECVFPLIPQPPVSEPPVIEPQPNICRLDSVVVNKAGDGAQIRVHGQFSGVPEINFRDGDMYKRALLDAYSDTEALVYVPRFDKTAAETPLKVYVDCVVGRDRTRSHEAGFVYMTTNQPPVAIALEAAPRKAGKNKGRRASSSSRKLDGSSSYDVDGHIVRYEWKLGKKVVSRKPTTPIAGKKTQTYRLCVTDNRKAKNCTKVKVKAKAQKKITVTLNNDVLFGFDSSTLSPKGKKALAKVRKYMSQAKSVEIAGHASSEGSDSYNLALSKARATTVRGELLRKTTKKKQPKTKVKAYGESKPVATNATEAGRAKNRRVVITIKLR